jgi:hypothetical protein
MPHLCSQFGSKYTGRSRIAVISLASGLRRSVQAGVRIGGWNRYHPAVDGSVLLVTRSCTTGWTDWVHGELWLLPDHLVRRRLSHRAARDNGNRRRVASLPVEVYGPYLNLDDIAAAHPTNKVLPLDAVLNARLHRGLLNDRLAVTMRDGECHKLLWLKVDPAHEILSHALADRLGPRLVLD